MQTRNPSEDDLFKTCCSYTQLMAASPSISVCLSICQTCLPLLALESHNRTFVPLHQFDRCLTITCHGPFWGIHSQAFTDVVICHVSIIIVTMSSLCRHHHQYILLLLFCYQVIITFISLNTMYSIIINAITIYLLLLYACHMLFHVASFCF